jgi:hypothetical protein
MAFDRSVRAALAAAGLALAACQTTRDVASDAAYELNPFASTDLIVRSIDVRGPYLAAEVAGRQEQLVFLAPATGVCAQVLEPEAGLRYAKHGVFGRFTRDGQVCDPTGVASLEAWRDRQPRPRTQSIVPRATARFAAFAEEPRWILVRGRFPLASKIGIPAGYDLVAMLPNDDVCRSIAARGEASLEFRLAGRDPYRLLAGDRACVVAGFAMPPATPATPPDAASTPPR